MDPSGGTPAQDPQSSPPRTPPRSPESPPDLPTFLEEHVEGFVEHLDELRTRLIISLVAFGVAAVVGWVYGTAVVDHLAGAVGRLIFVAPTEAFVARLKIAASVGVLLASPVFIVQAWRFVLPALFDNERRTLGAILWASVTLLAVGITFGYFVVYPISLGFFLSFETEGLRPAITVSRILSFFLGTTLSFGLMFQLPLVLIALVRMGIFTAERLRDLRRPAIFFAFVAAGVFTPADAVSQILMAVPLIVFYEVALWIAPRFAPADPWGETDVG